MTINLIADQWTGEDGVFLWIESNRAPVTVAVVIAEKKKVFVNGRQAILSYNGHQLCFSTLTKDVCYIVTDERHAPPVPIKQLYQELK